MVIAQVESDSIWLQLRRFLAVAALAVWIGGLTFYAVVVVPVGGELLGETQQGFVTQRVTNWLNVIGAVALLLVGAYLLEHRGRLLCSNWCVLLLIEIGLCLMHVPLDRMLENETTSVLDPDRFYGIHRIYLLLTTAQWLFGVVALWACLMPPRRAAAGGTP